MAELLSSSASDGIRKMMDETTADPNKIPGCVAVVVDKSGNTLFQHASGKRGADTEELMTLDSVFWIASCTKMIAGIAAMQLVEREILALDDADLIERHCPELKHVRIIKGIDKNGRAETVEKKNRITLRMLLTHTAGFGYTFFNDILRLNGLPVGTNEFDGHSSGILEQPIMFEPGTDWAYGVGIDWAGTLIERTTNQSLNTYFQTHIFAPLNLHHITLLPTPQMKANIAHLHQKPPSPSKTHPIRTRDHLLRLPLITTPSQHPAIYNSAGAGAFARPTDYIQILATLLNDGVSPKTGIRILNQESIEEMFTNQIPQFPDFGRKGIKSAKRDLSNDIPDMYPQDGEPPQGWGVTFMLTLREGETGRGRGTAWWAGLPNLFWWCDREKNVAGILATQILPFADADVMGLWFKIEKAIYDALGNKTEGDPQEQQEGKDDKMAVRDRGLDGYQQEFVANIDR